MQELKIEYSRFFTPVPTTYWDGEIILVKLLRENSEEITAYFCKGGTRKFDWTLKDIIKAKRLWREVMEEEAMLII